MTEFPSGTVIDGRYEIKHRLGSGGMADVFCAQDRQLGRDVALKLLHRRFAADPAFVERFRREAQAAAGLQHPNVVSVYDRGEFEGTYYIAMEYLHGRTLKQLIREEAPLEPVRAIDITIQILKAARFAHRRGVVHRDLKPHNVMIDESDHAKVTDFGIARAGASDMTETGSIMGTAQYLSPEQAQGLGVTDSADLYSIGVVLYEMLTGRVPFDADSAVTIALKHVSEAPVPPSQFAPGVPLELEQVVLWALNKEPADRPADADQFLAALLHARETIIASGGGGRTAEMAALAVAGGLAAADAPPTRVQPAQVAAVDAAAAYAAGAAAGRSVDPIDPGTGGYETVPPAPGEDQPRRAERWPWLALLILLIAGAGVAAYLLTRPDRVTVPVVVHQPVPIAQTILQNDGFSVSVISRTDPAPKDTVIGQFPGGGQKADKGSTVTLTVSSGPGPTTVPSVTDLPQKQAEDQIKRAGLRVGRTVSQTSATVNKGNAIGTDPGAGTALQSGQDVTLFVSSGQPPVVVPNVVGLSRSDALGRLSGLNINVQVTKQVSTTDTPDTVTAQSATGKVAPGSTVTLTVATAPPNVAVPDVTGKKAADASKTLQGAGFTVAQSSQTVTDKTQDGVVISESPSAGTQVAQGSTVKIVVGQFHASTTTTPTPPTPTTTTPPTTPTTTTPKP